MSDFLSKLVEADAPVAREVTVRGETGTVHFRRITAGQRETLLKGLTATSSGKSAVVEVDLGQNEHTRHLMVHYSVCHPDGKPFFKDVGAVKKLDTDKVVALYKVASEVNKTADDEDEAGKG